MWKALNSFTKNTILFSEKEDNFNLAALQTMSKLAHSRLRRTLYDDYYAVDLFLSCTAKNDISWTNCEGVS